jgi:3-deoxy-manno-octulosonate cytidylyltransferase (CMP-KDO synthetase)
MRDEAFGKWFKQGLYFRHIGIYGFSYASLSKIQTLGESSLEKQESLEQLRWLENNLSIGLMESPYLSIGVDVLEDVERVESLMVKDYSKS